MLCVLRLFVPLCVFVLWAVLVVLQVYLSRNEPWPPRVKTCRIGIRHDSLLTD